MDRTVPPGAALLLDYIGEREAPRGYNTIYGNNQGKLPKPVTSMTVGEVLAAQPGWSQRYGSSATGRYQFMYATLKGLVSELGLGLGQIFDANLQDRLGYHLLKRRGYEAFMSRKIDRTEFGKRIAQEWASFPVLAAVKGAHRQLVRGQSYYAGDGVNKALIDPASVEKCLDAARSLADAAPDPQIPTRTVDPTPEPASVPVPNTGAVAGGAAAVGILAAIIAGWEHITNWLWSLFT
jgi:muramidase (phage lysozyme)